MTYTEIRKLSLKGFIGFLALTAVIAIVFVLVDAFGSLQVKVLATSITISIASICAMSCAAYVERTGHVRLGLAGIATASLAALLVIVGVWADVKVDPYWKTTGSLIVLAFAFAHGFLLRLPDLDAPHRWVQTASSVVIGVLVIQILSLIWGEIDNEVFVRLLVVVAILTGLVSLVIPILMKLRKGEDRADDDPARPALTLTHVADETYRDAAGALYRVRAIDAVPEAPDG